MRQLPLLPLVAFFLLALPLHAADKEHVVAPPGTNYGLPFSPGILGDDFLYLSGAIGNQPGTIVVEGDTAAQVKQTMANLEAVLKVAELDFSRVVASSVFLSDIRHFQTMNEVYGGYFSDEHPPTRTTIEADIAIPNSATEIGMIAARKGVELEWIKPEGWPGSANYGYGVKAGETLFLSGLVSSDPKTGELVLGDVGVQTRQVLKNIDAVLKAAGMSKENVVRCGVYLPDVRDYGAMNDAYGAYFKEAPPARATVQARLAHPDLRIEITCLAVAGERKVVHPEGTPVSTRPLSSAIQVGDRLFLSGMVGRKDGEYPHGVAAQTHVVFERLKATLAAAGMGFDDVVSAQVFITDVRFYQAMNKVYAKWMPETPPARATVGTGLMSPDALVEIQMTAAKK